MQIQDKKLNSGEESSPPSLILPAGDRIRKKMINVKTDIETVNKVSKLETTKFLELERNTEDGSGKIKTKLEKRIARPELIKKTG
tara:strand:+ start:78 stop:332 length:255 start_codon:yes stop_codon:yes gene_type:complete